MATHPTGPAGPYRAQSLTRGLHVLRTLAAERHPLTLVQLNQLTGIPKPTLVRLLAILTSEGCTVRRDDRPTYDLGPTMVEIAAGVGADLDPSTAARPRLEQLCAQVGHTVTLAVLRDAEVLTVCVATPDRPVHFVTHTGLRRPSWSCAAGKVLLAFADPATTKAALSGRRLTASTSRTLTTKSALDAALRDIRRQGFGHDDEEGATGLRGFAAPLLVGGTAIGAISIAGPAAELALDRSAEVVPPILAAATDLSGHASLVRGLQSLSGSNELGASA